MMQRSRSLLLGLGVLAGVSLLLPVAAVAASPSHSSATAVRPLKFAIGMFQHEATTFNRATADIVDFPVVSGPALLTSSDDIRGFAQALRAHPEVTLAPLESVDYPTGSSSKGWITRRAFERIAQRMVADLKRQMPVDGVYLSLHGAAAVEGIRDPEAELARRIRAAIGPKTPIVATFDLHGNQDETFLLHADAAFAVKYFPHYDFYDQGARAGRVLMQMTRGEYRATTATRRPGIITPTIFQWTGRAPWSDLVQRALVWEAREPNTYVSVFFGFPWSDVENAGATVQVTTNNDPALAAQIADDMSGYMQRRRHDLATVNPIPVAVVAAELKRLGPGDRPVVLADYADRAGDATHILAEVVKHDLSGVLFATVRDERVIAALQQRGAKSGEVFDELVGGFVEVAASGAPVRIRGRLSYFGPASPDWRAENIGSVAVVEFGRGNLLMITDTLHQVIQPDEVSFAGIDPNAPAVWVLKSRAHFRAGFDDTGFARTALIVDPPGPFVGTVHLDKLRYRYLKLDELYPYNERREHGGGKQ